MSRSRIEHQLLYLCSWLFCLRLLSSIQADDSVDLKRIPSIWSSNQDGRGDAEQSYRLLAEINIAESEKTFIIEEFASSTREAFRLDIIEAPSGARRTILSNKKTGESFKYSPFQCSLITDIQKNLVPELSDKFPTFNHTELTYFVPTGIGALWLRAIQSTKYEYYEPKYEDPNSSIIPKPTMRVLETFARFAIPDTPDYKYRLNMYFRDPNLDGAKNLALIHIGYKSIIKMKIKIIESEATWITSSLGDTGKYYESDVFDLPVGYGCQRSANVDTTPTIPVGHLNYDKLTPHVIQLSMVALQPTCFMLDYEKWKTHTSSIRMVTGRLTLPPISSTTNKNDQNVQSGKQDYLVVEIQDYAGTNSNSSKLDANKSQTRLRRRKRVLSLGQNALSPSSDTPSSNPSRSSIKQSALYFDLDELRGQCLEYGEIQWDEQDGIDLPEPILNKLDRRQQETSFNIPAEGLHLNSELIELLFGTYADYQLIMEKAWQRGRTSTRERMFEVIHERRVDDFKWKNSTGQVVWTGTVSIIRQQSIDKITSVPSQTIITLLFFSWGLDRVVSKIHFNVIEKRPVSIEYFHRELNVASCFSGGLVVANSAADDSTTTRYLDQDKKTSMDSLEFTIEYPIESSTNLGTRMLTDQESEQHLYEQFLRATFAASDGRLDLQQLIDVEITFGSEMISVSGKLLERPYLLNYRGKNGLRLTRSKKSFTEFKPDKESCAESCDHYDCYMFAYCSTTRTCDLLLGGHKVGTKQPSAMELFEPSKECSVYIPRLSTEQRISPIQLVHRMRELVLSAQQVGDDDQSTNPLALETLYQYVEKGVDGLDENKTLYLLPSSFRSGAFSTLDVDAQEFMADVDNSPSSVLQVSPARDNLLSLRTEYLVLFENRKFVEQGKTSAEFPVRLAKHMSYQDCEELCSETDCRSFSHCRLEQSCQVSSLHRSKTIETRLTNGEFCFVMAREYLSKFQRTIRALAEPSKSSKSLSAGTSRDCAVSCMDEESFNCRSFYYCANQQPNDCHLRRSHLSSVETQKLINSSGLTETTTAEVRKDDQAAKHYKCDLYTRSFLAEFDKFYGKALPYLRHDALESSTLVLRGRSAEVCSVECAERQGSCPAFHVCRSDVSHEPTCALLNLPTATAIWNESSVIEPNQLVDNKLCTTFMVSPRSELNLPRRNGNFKPVVGEEDDDATMIDGAAIEFDLKHSQQSGGWSWAVRLTWLLVGLVIGYAASAFVLRGSRQGA